MSKKTEDVGKSENLRKRAEKLLKKAASPDLSGRDMQEMINELQTYQAELEIQNEELRVARTQLEKSRDRLSALFQFAPVGYVILNEFGMVTDANRTICKMLKKERVDILNKPFSDLIEPADVSVFQARFRSFYKKPDGKSIEIRHRCAPRMSSVNF